ncbi:MAG: sigma-70 family RNA polymerase sigma factor [Planctomycetales bacterium]|nr:sigma-70 family RNA polymerase sigma factor [Planctomycetales bacterium]MCA9165589.1 sigma-70 family RNA polymerase sigma factor [Planctomycetales bacterium]MCA9210428.1 sigma-70 family RNA polymerase sigma factor [Planctomycetales bacterium]MCA9219863.1 sigma-70 family RNA polymerase sigma factor [Planctomycetales bacterium]
MSNAPDPPIDPETVSSDAALLSRFRRGEEDAATALYLRYARRLARLAERQTGSQLATRFDPEDVVQSVFRTFFRRAAQGHYQIPEGDELWKLLLVIALNKVRAWGEFHRAAKRNVDQTGPLADVDTETGDDERALRTLRMTIDDLLGKMPESQREMIALRIEGCEVNEIAERTQRSKRSVERTLQAFRERLNKTLQAD